MKELTTKQVEEVSGGFIVNPLTIAAVMNAVSYGINAYRAYKTVRVVTQAGAASGVGGFLDGISD